MWTSIASCQRLPTGGCVTGSLWSLVNIQLQTCFGHILESWKKIWKFQCYHVLGASYCLCFASVIVVVDHLLFVGQPVVMWIGKGLTGTSCYLMAAAWLPDPEFIVDVVVVVVVNWLFLGTLGSLVLWAGPSCEVVAAAAACLTLTLLPHHQPVRPAHPPTPLPVSHPQQHCYQRWQHQQFVGFTIHALIFAMVFNILWILSHVIQIKIWGNSCRERQFNIIDG